MATLYDVHDEVAASCLVVFIDKPALDAHHHFRSDVLAQELAVDAESSDQNCRIDHVALLLRHILPNTFLRAFSSAVRTKRTAASPDKTGMLLISSAMSDLPSAMHYSKNLRGVLAKVAKTALDT